MRQVCLSAFDLPLTRVDPETNDVVRQWKGKGGDSMRFGHGTLWLTNYFGGTLSRLLLKAITQP